MFVEDKAQGEPLTCCQCGNVIFDEPVRIDRPDLPDASGIYHAPCAKTIQTVVDAYDACNVRF